MKLAINGQQLSRTQTLAEICVLARELGVSALELWPQNIEGGETAEARERYEEKDVAGAARVLAEHDMAVACVTLGFNALRLSTALGGARRASEALCGAVDAAAQLHAPIVNCYLAGIPAALFVEIATPAAAYAGAHGVTIVLENEAHDDSATPAAVRAMVEGVGSPHLGTEYDPCNYYHAYEEPYPLAYEVLKDHIRYVHLKGGCFYDERSGAVRGSLMRGRDDRRIGYVPLPESAFNVEAIIRRLAHDGYDGYVTLEPHVPPEQVRAFYAVEVPYVRKQLAAL